MTPAVTALLTTHNRAHLLPRVLEGLQTQTLPRSEFEIVAIDDGSRDDTPNLLASFVDQLPLRIFRQGASGLATAKNLGIFAARAPIIVFLDDDDILEPDALRTHLATHQANPDPATAVLARTDLDPAVAKAPLMRHVTEVGGQLFSYKMLLSGKKYDYREFWGGRSSCKRDFLLKHGVFNPDFLFGFEDIELGWRLNAHGLSVVYEPAARSRMIRSIGFEEFCRRSILQGRSLFKLSRMHSEAEIQAYCGVKARLALWAAEWRNYAAVLRDTARRDALSASGILAGQVLETEFQRKLDASYARAFALSMAKGVADAAQFEAARPRSGRKGLGLPGDFAAVQKWIEASRRQRLLSD